MGNLKQNLKVAFELTDPTGPPPTPYVEDINASIRSGLEGDGFKVAAIHGMGIDVNFELDSVPPEEIAAFSQEKLRGPKADVLFFS